MTRAIRRVVTGHLPDGRSTVLIDAPAPNVKQRKAGNASTLLWVTEECPAEVSGASDRAARDIGVPPPRRGSIFRIAEFPPQTGGEVRDNETVLRDFGIGSDVARGHPPRHPAIHRTRTLDYVIVLEGEIDLLLDAGEVRQKLLRPSLWVSEVVYVPLEPPLLKAARRMGCQTADGGHMNVGQALGAFKLFTGLEADPGRMDAHFRRLVSSPAE